MEMNFREYAEGWGAAALGALGGAVAGTAAGGPLLGWPLMAAGAYYGNKYGGDQQQQQPKVDPKYFVYYRDIDGQVHKELLRNVGLSGYIPIGKEYEERNADRTHPYFYYGKPGPEGKPTVVQKTKAGYQSYQRQSRNYGRQQQSNYGRQQQSGSWNTRGQQPSGPWNTRGQRR